MVAMEELIEATWDEMLAWKDWMAARMAELSVAGGVVVVVVGGVLLLRVA